MDAEINQKSIKGFRFLGIALIIQGIIALLPSLVIPGDPKNSFFLGFSVFRWANILMFLVIIVFLIFISLNVKKFSQSLYLIISRINEKWGNLWLALFLIILFWITIWFPATRLPKLQDEIIRIKPFLLFLELFFIEFFVFFNRESLSESWKRIINALFKSKFKFIIIIGAVIIMIFCGFRLFLPNFNGSVAFLTPGPPIFPLQLLFSLVIFISLFIFEVNQTKQYCIKKNKWDILVFFLIWAGTFLLWFFTPFTCFGDRPGPFPPNNICYPPVDDSYLSIGSHYTSLGSGVFNNWFTDKPFYMFFLALGQWIFGQRIDQYIVFQVIVISSAPALLFLLVRNWVSKSGSALLAILAAILGMNNIFLYSELDGANVFIENTELLTGFLLILFAISLTKHFSKKNDLFYIFITGCLLGLATLTRMNPIFILPLLIGVVFIHNRFDIRKGIKHTLVCLLGFFLIFSPWLFTAKDVNGNNYYSIKIEGVLDDRYQPGTASSGVEDEFHESPTNSSPGFSEPQNFGNKIGNLFVYFLNNEAQSLAKLPINLTLYSMPVIYNQAVWTKSSDVPIWMVNYSFENIVVIFLNLLIIIYGISFVLRRFGISGIIPLIIQIGYYIGNGAAQTSGDRYLQPVDWVNLLYFSVGIYALAISMSSATYKFRNADFKETTTSTNTRFGHRRSTIGKVGLSFLVLFLGLSLYLTNFLKDQTTTMESGQIITYAQNRMDTNSDLTGIDLNQFLKNPDSIIAEGIAFHARYYSSPLFFEQPNVFETTILGANKVLISNWIYEPEMVEISDGSRVILIGCKINEQNFWGGLTSIIKTTALIQLDGEKNLLIAEEENFNCQ